MTPESRVKKKVKELLDAYHVYQNWPVPAGYGRPMLDCVACHQGRFLMVETKRPGEVLTPRQELTRDEVHAAGGVVFVVGERINEDGIYSGMQELEAWLREQCTP